MNVEYLNKTSDNKISEKNNKLISKSYSKNKKLTRKYFDYIKKKIDQINKDTEGASRNDNKKKS